ncbi:MAG: protein-L-isoaspartate(D-aspartate) O-methyltransferase [Proteobacteria bacterium]|nr:protein-L-isoaspartate(D-aspartate) O-methyltransferase [Pseudomonadota bacterium]
MTKRKLPLVLALLVAVAPVAPVAAAGGQDYAELRRVLIESIEDDVRATAAYIGRARLDDRVMAALARVPRHEFVPERVRPYAYENRPLPIGYGQTISQPYIVALMTDLLALGEDSVVLEIGTGSAYQAAVLAELVARVYTIEIVEPLGSAARRRLARLGYDNVEVRIGDGYDGWAEHAPFDAIMVTAAASHVPPPLLGQLKPGGRLVIPVGDRFFTQQLILIEKRDDGALTTTQVLPVRFVPLVRAE